ncbi:hypothetical protein HED49_23660 [Ochrobactrum daejeonense]|nr:hypothetical protein [Brucella daejeonensis]
MSEQEFEDGNRFKRKVHWRDSMREPRLMIFDARLVFPASGGPSCGLDRRSSLGSNACVLAR